MKLQLVGILEAGEIEALTCAGKEILIPTPRAIGAHITNQPECQEKADKVINLCLKSELEPLTKNKAAVNEANENLEENNLKLTCPPNDQHTNAYSLIRKEHVIKALRRLRSSLKMCVAEIKDTVDCCKEPLKCFGLESGLSSVEISLLTAALSGTLTGGITAFINHSSAKAICDGLTAATATAGLTNLTFGAACVFKGAICHGACNIAEPIKTRNINRLSGTITTNTIKLDELFPEVNQLQDYLKDFCGRSARRGAAMIADSALLGTSAGLIAHHCEKTIGGDGSGDNDTPENALNRNKNYCTKPENANRDFCRICNPGSETTAAEYNTNTLMRYPSCRQLPIQELVAQTTHFSGGSGRFQRRTPNQGLLNPSQKQESELFSGYGRSAHSNLGTTSQVSGPGGGENHSIGNSETTSSHLNPSSDEAEDQSQVSNQTSDVGFSESGGSGSGSSGSFYSSRGQSKSRWNLKDFLPGRKKDPKKKGSKISKSPRKKLLNVRSKPNNIFVTHSKIIHKFCSNKTLNQCHSSSK